MEAKKIYESGKLHGVYRCGKREELVNKIPRIDKEGMPDVTGIVISGIMNFGNDADMIKAMAKDAIGCKAEDIKIPYDESQFARRRFINDVIVGKLTGSVRFSTQALIDTFYEFLEMPTETTKQMQAKDDLRDIERYLNNEARRPIVLGHPIINLCGANFECQMDFAFLGPHIVKTNKHKEGRKWVYDEEEVYLAEAVRIFPNKPAVKETSKILDVGIGTRCKNGLTRINVLVASQSCCVQAITTLKKTGKTISITAITSLMEKAAMSSHCLLSIQKIR